MIHINNDIARRLDFKKPETWLATWGGSGLMAPAPGTWGTLAGLPVGILLMILGGPVHLVVGIVLVTAAGWWATGQVEAMTGDHDGGYIVIDEVAGVWIALLAASPTPLSVILAFLLFRAFDIVKPFPCNWLDQKLTGAASVMLDDIAAGLYAALCLIGLRYVGLG